MNDSSPSAPDLSRTYPRSPRETLGGYVVAARTLDKCRAEVAGTLGEYHFDCPLDNLLFDFTGITADQLREKVSSGATDEEIGNWLRDTSKVKEKREVIKWNNDLRYKRISEMPIELQEFLEEYIPENLPDGSIVYYWFDVYDIEEERI
ncbi:MAG: DUF5069 domain-containing protein [Verrucomicrobiales bacterium]|nr:DUF5069 domain-containing protein [Verrucomicrobiales bacterium]